MTAEVPRFTKGEPGFTDKLNQLADAVRELQEAAKPKTATRARKAKADDDGESAD